MSEISEELARRIVEIREDVVMSTLRVVTIAGGVLFLGNMLRNLSLGSGLSPIHAALFTGILAVYALRQRIGAARIAWLILALTYVAGAVGIFLYSLASNSVVVLLGFCFVAAAFFGARGGISAAALSGVTIALAGALFLGGVLPLAVNVDAYLNNPFTWIAALLSFAAIASVVLVQLHGLHTRQMQLLGDQHHQARHDALTGLANRTALEAVVEQAVAEARRTGQNSGVVLIDLDRFKTINDSLGHQTGDALLVEVAQRLRNCLRPGDTVARLGGDEFVVVLPRLSPEDITLVARRIVATLSAPYRLAAGQLHSTPSIGIALGPQDSNDVGTLIRYADTAMYEAKARGGGQFQFFAPAMNEAATRRLHVESRLRDAIAGDGFRIVYQAKVDATRRLSGFEALIRWPAQDGSLQSPGVFIPIAEESDLINEIGDWVLEHVCRQIRAWLDQGLDPVPVAVNVSPRQLRQADLPGKIRATLSHWKVPPELLELEITEGAVMENPERSTVVLDELARLGIALSIDDFGTGYSSLSRLSSLPVSVLKIDRSFVKNIEQDLNDRAIAVSTIALAHGLGMRVVAEGVETEGQWGILAEHGCDEIQGFLLSRPEPAEVAEALLRQRILPFRAAVSPD